jgi:capsular polysaccharide biosynthesis protein
LIRESQHRRVINEEIFVTEAEKRGFEKISLSRLSFDEQYDLFQNASVIAGFGGAEWANLVLANSDVKILNFVSESMSGFLGHINIGHSMGINKKTIVLRNANIEHPTLRESIQTPVKVNHGDFELGLSLL